MKHAAPVWFGEAQSSLDNPESHCRIIVCWRDVHSLWGRDVGRQMESQWNMLRGGLERVGEQWGAEQAYGEDWINPTRTAT